MPRNTPTAAEIEEIGRLLAKHWGAKARKALAPWLNGVSPWTTSLRQVRLLLKEVVRDVNRGPKVPISVRARLTEFGVKYGTETHGVDGDEPLEIQKLFRFGRNEWADIERAAAEAGITPTKYVRGAALKAAREGTT